MPVAQVTPSQKQRISSDRNLDWLRDLYGFVERSPQYYVQDHIRLAAPFPGTSRYNEEELDTAGFTQVGDGSTPIDIALAAPPRGTLRNWVIVIAETEDTVSKDARLGLRFNTIDFAISTDPSWNNDDGLSMMNLICCSGMVPFFTALPYGTNLKDFTIRGLFVDYPEGEVASFPSIAVGSQN